MQQLGDSLSRTVDASRLMLVEMVGRIGGRDHAQSVPVVDEDSGVTGDVPPLGRQYHRRLLLQSSITG